MLRLRQSFGRRQRGFKELLLLSALFVVASPSVAPAQADDENESAKPAVTNENLGSQLLDDTKAPAPTTVDAKTGAEPESMGEDIGAGQGGPLGGEALQRVKQQMRTAESILTARDASRRASVAQAAAVGELDAVIARLQKQCEKCGGQCKKPDASSSQPKPGAKAGSAPGQMAATAASAPAAPADRAAIASLVKDLWGRLPERQRDELLQPLSEEFLPAYAADIEEYFRVLAESPEHKPAEKRP